MLGAVCANEIALSPTLMTHAAKRMKFRISVSLLVWEDEVYSWVWKGSVGDFLSNRFVPNYVDALQPVS